MVMIKDLGLTIPTSVGIMCSLSPLVLVSCVLTIPTSVGIMCAHYPH